MDETALDPTQVRTAHGVAGLRLPTGDSFAIWDVLKALGGLMANFPSDEKTSRRVNRFREGARALDRAKETTQRYADFLRNLNANLTFDFNPPPACLRALELVNKTSEFNLNGLRFTTTEWQSKANRPGAFLVILNYQDKFGPLGKISVIEGHQLAHTLHVESWVIRDRALNRRIEHQSITKLFDAYQVSEINFQFAHTARNGATRDFFNTVLGRLPETNFILGKDQWDSFVSGL
ncbi:MAG TPA: hypothetical protein VHZ55_12995 [Bryobacteraceae bacterium]|nr:hypothetical protein [Bryobacteraceae bacterium]